MQTSSKVDERMKVYKTPKLTKLSKTNIEKARLKRKLRKQREAMKGKI